MGAAGAGIREGGPCAGKHRGAGLGTVEQILPAFGSGEGGSEGVAVLNECGQRIARAVRGIEAEGVFGKIR